MEAVVDPCRRFHECEGCSHCSENPRRCEYCADPWDECLCDFQLVLPDEDEDACPHCHGNEDELCDKCGDYFTTCDKCGEMNIPVDYDGMAAELCEACEVDDFPAVKVISALSELSVDLEGMNLPDMSGNAKADYLRAIADAVHLLRAHVVPEGHPWAVK